MKPALGIFLNLGDSFTSYHQGGRDIHWLNNYLKYYPQAFRKPLVFSYAQESNPYPRHISLLPNKTRLPRFVYTLLIPFIYSQSLKQCQVLRVKQMPGIWPAIIAKLIWQIPIVATYGYDYTYFAKQEGHLLNLPFIKLTEIVGLKFSDKVIVTNQAIKEKLKQLIPQSKIILLPNGVNTRIFKPKIKKPNQTMNIVSVGRLVHQKNFSSLITAVSHLKSAKKIKLTILGRGPLEKRLINQAKKLKINLQHIPSRPHDKVVNLLQSADIFIMASHHEGSPKALLEAMACGLPCVVSNKPFSRFIIAHKKDAFLTQNDPISLAKAIQTLIDKPQLRKKLGQKARQTILTHFNNQKIIQREINLLKSVVYE